jgi:hypothetical protein
MTFHVLHLLSTYLQNNKNGLVIYSQHYIYKIRPIPSKEHVCGRSLPGNTDSNPAGRIDVSLFRMFFDV